MLPRFRVTEALRKTEIDHVQNILASPAANEEIVWLNVAMDKILRVQVLDAVNQLLRDHHHRLHG